MLVQRHHVAAADAVRSRQRTSVTYRRWRRWRLSMAITAPILRATIFLVIITITNTLRRTRPVPVRLRHRPLPVHSHR